MHLFLVLWFAFSIIHGSGRASKNIFRTVPLPCIILNANQRTKNGGRPENKATQTPFEQGAGNMVYNPVSRTDCRVHANQIAKFSYITLIGM